MKIDMKEDLNDIYWIDREICEYKVYIRKCKKSDSTMIMDTRKR